MVGGIMGWRVGSFEGRGWWIHRLGERRVRTPLPVDCGLIDLALCC